MFQQFQTADQFDQNAIYKKASYTGGAVAGGSGQKIAESTFTAGTYSNAVAPGNSILPIGAAQSEDRSRQNNVANNLQGNSSQQQQTSS
jgi:hypothetical protein